MVCDVEACKALLMREQLASDRWFAAGWRKLESRYAV
jgi:hypothetical protein